MHKIKMKWTWDNSCMSLGKLDKVEVDAGNIEEALNLDWVWDPAINIQIERLVDEWSNPDSDGVGYLTYSKIATEMQREIRNEIDNEILRKITGALG